jgi:hypothetical protein
MDWKTYIIYGITLFLILFNLYSLINITNSNMEEKAKEITEANTLTGLDLKVIVKPDTVYIALWNVLNITFYLFLMLLIYNGRTKDTIQK